MRKHKLQLKPSTSPPIDTGGRRVGVWTPMVEVLGLGSTAVCTIASREMFDSRLEYLDAGELDI